MANDFEDLMGEFFDAGGFKPLAGGVNAASGAAKKEEKGLPWTAKEFNGDLYVPLAQVAELLDQNGVLPKVSKGLKVRVQAQEDKKALDL